MITYDLLRPTILYDADSLNKFVIFKHPLMEEHSFLERQVWHAGVTARMLQPKHPVRGNQHSHGCYFNVTNSNCTRTSINPLSRECWNMSLSKQQKCTQIRSKKTNGVKRISQVLKTKLEWSILSLWEIGCQRHELEITHPSSIEKCLFPQPWPQIISIATQIKCN